ncbi:uncharacterized protein LOC106713009 [Papilio machaon]|uniref:uncharacterized protein LOC106713009 n=1 Tax=Papilio machaon TaxID=76193 RepID=UPI001E665076|nr:uncharacterized protein LOC106713009 [Papilio machaon]
MVTTKRLAAFGSGVKRFGKNTGHPKLDPNGLYISRPEACDPCLYHPQDIDKVFDFNKHIKNRVDPWKYKSDLEEWSKNLGYRNQKVLDRKKWFDSLLGPAWHDVQDDKKYEPACNNVGFGRTPRFKHSTKSIPGPGTYYKHVPYKAPHGPHSKKQTFEMQEPCRFKDPAPKWSLAPNRYNIIDKDSIEEKPKKIVSLRGPYDLFTGKRDGTSIKNHFNRTKVSAASWPYSMKGCMETYKRSHYGEMNKTNRELPCRSRNTLVDLAMCIRYPSEPGPGQYDVERPRQFVQNAQGFNSSYDRPPGYRRAEVWPAVGRYHVRSIKYQVPGGGHRHAFLSKVPRTIGAVLPQPMNTF